MLLILRFVSKEKLVRARDPPFIHFSTTFWTCYLHHVSFHSSCSERSALSHVGAKRPRQLRRHCWTWSRNDGPVSHYVDYTSDEQLWAATDGASGDSWGSAEAALRFERRFQPHFRACAGPSPPREMGVGGAEILAGTYCPASMNMFKSLSWHAHPTA